MFLDSRSFAKVFHIFQILLQLPALFCAGAPDWADALEGYSMTEDHVEWKY